VQDATSIDESNYWTTLSMRIFPFYLFPGYYRGMLCIDGCFTRQFLVPENANLDKGERAKRASLDEDENTSHY